MSRNSLPAGFVHDLGFILVIDNCARGCVHCPAYGNRAPVRRISPGQLERLLSAVAEAYRAHGTTTPPRTVHCWRISDPLDYAVRLPGGGLATCLDVARLWREYLDQGLYVVTNGSEGRRAGRLALDEFQRRPELVSQAKLTITPFDREWATERYVDELAADVRTLLPLWTLFSTRPEDRTGLRFRINVKASAHLEASARSVVARVLIRSGLSSRQAEATLDDPCRVRFKPVYDLGSATGNSPVSHAISIRDATGLRYKPTESARARFQYGVRPDLALFQVDMFAFQEMDLTAADGAPLRWPIDGEVL